MNATKEGYFSYTFPNIIEDAAMTLDPLVCHYDALQEIYKKMNADRRRANYEENMKTLSEIEKSLDKQLKEIHKQSLLNRVIKNNRKESAVQARVRTQLQNDADMYLSMRKFRRFQDDSVNNNANIFALISNNDGFSEIRVTVDEQTDPDGAECITVRSTINEEDDIGEGEEHQLGEAASEGEEEEVEVEGRGYGEGNEKHEEKMEVREEKAPKELAKVKEDEERSMGVHTHSAHNTHGANIAVQPTISKKDPTLEDALCVLHTGCGPGDCRERPFVIDDKDECLFDPTISLKGRARASAICCRNDLYQNDSIFTRHLGLADRFFDFDESHKSQSLPCVYNIFNTPLKCSPSNAATNVFKLQNLDECTVGEQPNTLILNGSTIKLISKINDKKLIEPKTQPRKRVKLCCSPNSPGCCLNAKHEGKYIDHTTIKEVYTRCKKNRARMRNITSR